MEMRRQKHREAQTRYRQKNAAAIRQKRFFETRKGRKVKLAMLHESDDLDDKQEPMLGDEFCVDRN